MQPPNRVHFDSYSKLLICHFRLFLQGKVVLVLRIHSAHETFLKHVTKPRSWLKYTSLLIRHMHPTRD